MLSKHITPHRDALLVFLLLAFAFGYFREAGGWNENSRFATIYSVVEQGSLHIDSWYNQPGLQTGDISFHNGHYYTNKAIGPVLVGIPVYYPLFLLQRLTGSLDRDLVNSLLTFVIVGLPSAFAGALMYHLAVHLTKDRRRAFLVTTALFLGTLAFPFSLAFFSHQFTASLLFVAFYLIFMLRHHPEKEGGFALLFLIGFLLGLAIISEYPAALIVLPLVVYYLPTAFKQSKTRRFRALMAPILGGAVPLLIQLAFNRIAFGGFFTTGYSHLVTPVYAAGHDLGFLGFSWPDLRVLYLMTVHPLIGTFWQSPVLLLAPIGFFVALRRSAYRAEIWVSISSILLLFVVLSGFYFWWGGWTTGMRHIVPALPFFCFGLLFLPKRLDPALVILGIISVAQMTIISASDIHAPYTFDWLNEGAGFFKYTNIYSYCLPKLLSGSFNTNMGNYLLGLRGFASLIPFLLTSALLTILFFAADRAGRFASFEPDLP